MVKKKKDKQLSGKHTHKLKDRVTGTILKTGDGKSKEPYPHLMLTLRKIWKNRYNDFVYVYAHCTSQVKHLMYAH